MPQPNRAVNTTDGQAYWCLCFSRDATRMDRPAQKEKRYRCIKNNTSRQRCVPAEQCVSTRRRFEEANPLEGWLSGHTQKSTLSAARDDAAQCDPPSRYRKRNWWPIKLQKQHQKEERISSPVLGPPGRLTVWGFASMQAACSLWAFWAALNSRFGFSPTRQKQLLTRPFSFQCWSNSHRSATKRPLIWAFKTVPSNLSKHVMATLLARILFANIKKRGRGWSAKEEVPPIKSRLLLVCRAGRFARRGLVRSLFTVLKLEQIRGSLRKQASLKRMFSFTDAPKTLDIFCDMLGASWVTKAWAQIKKCR